MSSIRPAIIGVGNMLMGDDGVGPAAIGLLRDRGLDARADLIDAGLAFSETLCDLEPDRPIVILDAVRGGGRPGCLYRIDVDDLDPSAASMGAAMSLHEASVLPALRMEALTGREFNDVTIFGIQPGHLDWGMELSGPVAEAMEKLVRAVCRHLDEHEALLLPGLDSPRSACVAGRSENR